MNAGKLRKKITIEIESSNQNTFGEPTQAWTAFASNIPASIDPISGKEFFASNAVQSDVTHKIRIRYLNGVKSKMRVTIDSRVFDIISVINFEERNRELLLMCKEAV